MNHFLNYLLNPRKPDFAILALFLNASLAHAADLSGHWIGSGIYDESDWGTFQAQTEITLERTADQLSIQDCWYFVAHGMSQNLCAIHHFEVDGRQLRLNGIKVGEIRETEIDIAFTDHQKSVTSHFSILPDQTATFFYSLTAPERTTKAVSTLTPDF